MVIRRASMFFVAPSDLVTGLRPTVIVIYPRMSGRVGDLDTHGRFGHSLSGLRSAAEAAQAGWLSCGDVTALSKSKLPSRPR